MMISGASFNIRTPINSWQKTFGGPKEEWAVLVQKTADGGYIIGAWAGDIWLIKTAANVT